MITKKYLKQLENKGKKLEQKVSQYKSKFLSLKKDHNIQLKNILSSYFKLENKEIFNIEYSSRSVTFSLIENPTLPLFTLHLISKETLVTPECKFHDIQLSLPTLHYNVNKNIHLLNALTKIISILHKNHTKILDKLNKSYKKFNLSTSTLFQKANPFFNSLQNYQISTKNQLIQLLLIHLRDNPYLLPEDSIISTSIQGVDVINIKKIEIIGINKEIYHFKLTCANPDTPKPLPFEIKTLNPSSLLEPFIQYLPSSPSFN